MNKHLALALQWERAIHNKFLLKETLAGRKLTHLQFFRKALWISWVTYGNKNSDFILLGNIQ